VQSNRLFRDLEPALAVAQRAGKKKRAKAIHAKISNRRKNALHKLSTGLVKNYGVIVVGNVSSSKLVKTKMAKSVLDAGCPGSTLSRPVFPLKAIFLTV
jgi:hypothetical protein